MWSAASFNVKAHNCSNDCCVSAPLSLLVTLAMADGCHNSGPCFSSRMVSWSILLICLTHVTKQTVSRFDRGPGIRASSVPLSAAYHCTHLPSSSAKFSLRFLSDMSESVTVQRKAMIRALGLVHICFPLDLQ